MHLANHRLTISSKSSRRHGLSAMCLAAALACGPAVAQGQSAAAPGQGFAAGRILVMPNAGMSEAALDKLVKEHGGGKAKRVGQSQLRIIDVPLGLEKQIVDKLSRHPHFKFAELDQAVEPSFVPNDPYLGSQWHTAKINAAAAWDYATGVGLTIGIVDTGVEATHPDLASRLVPGYNFYDNNTNTSPVNGHGTWVAGAAAAALNNGAGVAGLAGGAKIMPMRVVDSSGKGWWSAVASAITYAADNGVRVINASFVGLTASATVMNAAAYMKGKNGLVVVAAGNTASDPGYPRNSNAIVVSSTESNDTLSSFSSYGNHVTISAPGRDIWTTGLNGTYTQGWGTSFASPVVAGTVALMMSANPKLTSAQIESLLYASVDDLGTAGSDKYFGYGRVNTGKAVMAAVAAVSTADTQAPIVAINSPTANASVSGLVPVAVSASDNVGVTKVEFRVNGSLLASDTSAPYAFSWDSTKVVNGMATLQARAYDAAGNVTSSTSVGVNVANATTATTTTTTTTDTTAPTVRFVSPANGAKVSGTVTVSSSATDNNGTAGMKNVLFIDGVRVASNVGTGSFKYNWKTANVKAGSHTLRVDTTDASGNTSSASIVAYR